MKKIKIKTALGSKIFDICNITFLTLFAFSTLLPFFNALATSLSSSYAVINGLVTIFPVEFTLENYLLVFQNSRFLQSFKVTLYVTAVGTFINLFCTFVTAYPLSRPNLKGRNVFKMILIICMIVHVPMVPNYLVVQKLGLLDKLWALMLPSAVNIFYVIICINFLKTISEELFEAARIDGLGEAGILVKIALPLSKPIFFTLLLMFAVGHWNNYMSSLYYIMDQEKRPLQAYLYSLVVRSNMSDVGGDAAIRANELAANLSPESLKMATVLTATIPILCVYPFLQKHFVKGMMIGSVKG